MTHEHKQPHEHPHENHQKDHHHKGDHRHKRPVHKDWRLWVVVGLMLAAMVGYILSDNLALQPGGDGEPVPEAAE